MKSLWIISRAIIKNRYFGVLDRKTNWIINLVLLIGISMLTAACMIDLYSKLSVINITYIIPKMAIMGGNILMIIVMMPLFLSSLYKCNYIRFFSTYPVSSICCLMGKMIAICAVPYMIFTIMMELILSIYGVLKDIGYINLVLNSICIWMWVTLKFIYIGIICITLVKFLGRINLIKQLRLIVQIFLLFITVGIIGLIRSINLTYVLNQDSKVYLVSNSLLFKLYIEKSVENELMALIGLSIILIVALSIIYFLGNRFQLPDESIEKVNTKNKEYIYTQMNSLLFVYIKNDLKLLIREPVLFFQCIIKVLVMPILIIILFGLKIENIQFASWQGIIMIFGITYYESMINYVSATAISRDRSLWKFNQTIPISYSVQLFAKVILGAVVNAIVAVGTVVCFSIIMRIDCIQSLFLIGSLIVICIEGSLKALLIDLRNPIKAYTSEIQLVKSNPNIANIAIVTVIKIIIGTGIIIYFKLSLIQSFGILLCIHSLLLLSEIQYVKRNINRLYKGLNE